MHHRGGGDLGRDPLRLPPLPFILELLAPTTKVNELCKVNQVGSTWDTNL